MLCVHRLGRGQSIIFLRGWQGVHNNTQIYLHLKIKSEKKNEHTKTQEGKISSKMKKLFPKNTVKVKFKHKKNANTTSEIEWSIPNKLPSQRNSDVYNILSIMKKKIYNCIYNKVMLSSHLLYQG